MLEKIKKHKYIIFIVLISFIYFILTSVQNPLFKYELGDDDFLMVKAANSILNFKWLGRFVGNNLSKGPGAPIFIALTNVIGLTLTQAQFLLYLGGAILFSHSLKKVVKSDFLRIIIFIVLLFNPIMYSLDLLRVYRDNIYSSFLLYVVGFGFEIFFNYREKVKTLVPCMIGFGVFSTWMAITREETIWISPFVLGSSVITILFIIFDKECLDKKKKILLYLIPLFIYLVSIFCVCLFNKIAYGEFIRTECSSRPYKNFVKTVTSVDVEKPIISVPLQKEAREKIYKVSPSFSELKDVFEGEKGKIFEGYGRIEGEIEEGFFSWEVICALGEHGYFTNIKTFNDDLRKITDEVNKAFENGDLKKEDDKASILDKENFSKLIENMGKAVDFELNLVNVNLKLDEDKYYQNLDDLLERRDMFVEITGNTSTNSKTYNYKTDEIKINTLTFIKNIYEKINKPLFILSLIIYVLLILRFFFIKKRFKNYKEIIILTSLIMLYFIRIVVIAYVETKMCYATNVMYLSSIYSLQFLFVILSLIFGIKEIVNLKEFLNENKRECRNN